LKRNLRASGATKMASNPRHPGIFISAGSPVRPQPDGLPSYWHYTHPAVGSLERMNFTLPLRVGEAYPAYPAYPAAFSATNWPGFNSAGGLIALSALNAHLPHGTNGDKTLADKRPTIGRQQLAEPKEASKEPTYRAYRALFSHFPTRISCHDCTGENRVCAFP
jgi:hypothetical protein